MIAKAMCVVGMFLGVQTLQAQGILLVEQETRDGKATSNRIQLDKTQMRAESHTSGNTIVLFDSRSETVRMVDVDKMSYVEMNRAQIEQMRQQVGALAASPQMQQAQQQMAAQMAAMQEQLKNMPPEQRAQVEAMLGGRGGPGAPGMPAAAGPARGTAPSGPIEYRRSGTDKVGQWACTKYDGYRGQEKVSEVCAADPQTLGLATSDFDVTKKLAEFLKTLSPQAADRTIVLGTAETQGFAGVPIRRTSFVNGKATSVSEIRELRRESFPASTFEVPAGFRRETLPGGR